MTKAAFEKIKAGLEEALAYAKEMPVLIAESPDRIVGITTFAGRLIVATECGVWERREDGKFHPIEFAPPE